MVEALKDFPTDLGTILVRMGAITWDQLHIATEKKQWNPDEKLGDLLLRDGVIDEATLKNALDIQDGLRRAGGVPVGALQALFDYAVENFQRNNVRLSNRLDEVAMKR